MLPLPKVETNIHNCNKCLLPLTFLKLITTDFVGKDFLKHFLPRNSPQKAFGSTRSVNRRLIAVWKTNLIQNKYHLKVPICELQRNDALLTRNEPVLEWAVAIPLRLPSTTGNNHSGTSEMMPTCSAELTVSVRFWLHTPCQRLF